MATTIIMDFISRHKVILLTVVFVVAGFFWYSSSSQTTGSILTKDNANITGNNEDRSLVETLLTLRAVSLSGTILSDPSFRRLKDFSTPITLEPSGRADPFSSFSSSPLPQAPASPQGTQLFKAGRP